MDILKKFIEVGFINCDYLLSYIDLINQNISRTRSKGVTHRHHIIPRCTFIDRGIEVDNSNKNIVNLKYVDHIKAHYLLYMSSKGKLKYQMFYSIRALNNYVDIGEKLLNIPDETQEIYEYMRNKFIGLQLGKLFKGTCYINNGEKELRVPKQDVNEFLLDGFTKGRLYKHSEETKKLLNHTKGKIKISKDGVIKYVEKQSLKSFEEDGWKRDSQYRISDEKKEIIREKVRLKNQNMTWMHLDTRSKKIPNEDVEEYLKIGWKLGMYINEEKHLHRKEVHKGNKSSKGYIWINDGIVEKSIIPDNIELYRKKGFTNGRLKRNKN